VNFGASPLIRGVFGGHWERGAEVVKHEIVLSLAMAVPVATDAAPEMGRVCIAPLPADARRVDHDLSGGRPQKREHQYQFTVSIDGAPPVDVKHATPGTYIRDLALGRRHRVVIRDGSKRIESFSFTFEAKRSRDLCLSYGPWYQTWHLELSTPRAKWCRCGS